MALPSAPGHARAGGESPSCSPETSVCPSELPWRLSECRPPARRCPGVPALRARRRLLADGPHAVRGVTQKLRAPRRTDPKKLAYDSSAPYLYEGEEYKQPGKDDCLAGENWPSFSNVGMHEVLFPACEEWDHRACHSAGMPSGSGCLCSPPSLSMIFKTGLCTKRDLTSWAAPPRWRGAG